MELFHYGFWAPTAAQLGEWHVPPQLFSLWTPVALAVSVAVLVLGDWVFRRFEGGFAQEL